MHSLARRLPLLLPSLLVACAAAPASSTDSSEGAIQGGSASSLSSVGLVQPPSAGFLLCTGELIAPDVVLTAAHCVVANAEHGPFRVALPRGFYVGRGAPTTDVDFSSLSDMTRFDVIDVHSFTTDLGGVVSPDASTCPRSTADIALLHLAKPVTGVTPLTLADSLPDVGDACTVTGYGDHGTGDATTDLQRRTAKVELVASSASAISAKWTTGIDDRGDSGGPLICAGKVAGTVSCGPDFAGKVESRSFYVPMATQREAIEQVMAEWHGTTR